MSESSYTVERDLREARAMADGLIPYVHENRLYGTVGGGGFFGGGKMPSLTIGALLMRLRRLRALESQLTDTQRASLEEIEAQHENVRKEWTVHYTEKLNQEVHSRLKAMATFFEECEDNPRTCASIYLPETLRRTIVQDIAAALDGMGTESAELNQSIRNVDGKLRRFTEPAEFVWAQALEPAYPREVYWWLYAKPPKVDEKK